MTEALYLEDAYLRDAPARVCQVTAEGGIVLDRTIFYPTGGGQPGDSGWLFWDGKRMPIATTVKGEGNSIVLVPAEPQQMPQVGMHLKQSLDWDRRHRHMRVHTLLHLLSVAVPFGVTGGQISVSHGRLDFDMPDAPGDREDLRVSSEWITQEALRAAPDLVKTMAVAPPKGAERVRLVQIGDMESRIDLQPCGGTHVGRTGEIGSIQLGKVEKKGRHNRRVYVHLDT